MKLKKYILLMITLVMLSCGTKDVQESITLPTPPVATKSVQPQLTKVQDNIETIISKNEVSKLKFQDQSKTIEAQKVKIVEAIVHSERIKEQAKSKQLLAELDAMKLSTSLLEIRDLNVMIGDKNKSLEGSLFEVNELLQLTRSGARQTMQELQIKEAETNTLRDQNDFLAKNLTARNTDVKTLQGTIKSLQAKIEKLTKQAASAGVYKNWIIGLASGFLLWTILKNILMVYFPATKFRI